MWAVSTLKPAVGGAEGASPLFLFSLSLNLNQTIRLFSIRKKCFEEELLSRYRTNCCQKNLADEKRRHCHFA